MTGFVLAANNGDVGGGEVMLLETAEVLRHLGHEVSVVGPAAQAGVVDEARARGFSATALAPRRPAYARELRRWVHGRPEWLWCHGLVPAVATSGRRRRLVHLHQEPAPRYRPAAAAARVGAEVILVPSHHLAARVHGSTVLWNWTAPIGRPDRPRETGPRRVGFIGRHSRDKGLDVLARAIAALASGHPGGYRLVLAGDARFVPDAQRRVVAEALAPVEALTDHLGWCDREDFYSAVDIAVFPSTWPEPFGLVVSEAMSARVPVVVSDAGALPEVVGAEHPWVAPAGDPSGLARVIASCLDDDRAERAAVTAAAYRRWQTHWSPEAGRERVAELLDRLGVGAP